MEAHQGLNRAPTAGLQRPAALLAALLWAAQPACGLLGPTEPTGRNGESSDDRPAPWDDWLNVEKIAPDAEALSTQPTLELRFNAYLEDDAFQTYNVGALTSGGLSYGGWSDYRMVDKTLVWGSRGPVPEGLDVELTLTEALESVTGAPLERRSKIAEWSIDSETEPHRPTAVPTDRRWQKIQAIFARRCNGCHRDPQFGLNPLTYESLVGGRSEQVDRPLVRPYDAADSYLMHKLLWDYPRRRYQPQPPPWSADGRELPRAQLRLIEAWIDAGAPR